MKVGLTYDLRDEYLAEGYGEEETAEFDRPETIEAIENALRRFGFETDRIGHAKDLVARLAQGDRWDWVFNIVEGMYGIGREALVPALLEAYRIPCIFSDSMVLALTLHKGMTKHVIKHLGIPTPDFAVVESEEDIAAVNMPFPLFAKPVAEGTGKGITAASKLANREELNAVCRKLLADYRQPVLVERFLPGREYTVGLFGTGRNARAFGAMEVVLNADAENDVYSYHNKEHYEGLVEYRLVEGEAGEKAKAVALAAWRGLGCRDAGRIDVREDEHGTPNFIEVNPLAGIRPIHSDLCIICNLLGISYNQMIETIVRSALQRFDLPFPSAIV